MKGNRTGAFLLSLLWAVPLCPADLIIYNGAQPPRTPPMPPVSGDLLRFVDGSAMHGELKSADSGHGLVWSHPDAVAPIDLVPGHVDFIRFEKAEQVPLAPTCHFRFANGDDLFGTLTFFDAEQLGFTTWFGGAMKIPRESVKTITFLPKNYSILYEGPSDSSGWTYGDNSQWSYRDGTFSTSSSGSLGRDVNMSGSSTVEFDLAWTGFYNFVLGLYNDSYICYFYHNLPPRDQVTLTRVHPGIAPATFAPVSMPSFTNRNEMHVTLHCNQDKGTITLLVDNVLVKRWEDKNGLETQGGTIRFEQRMNGPVIRLSNIRISHWEGKFDPPPDIPGTNNLDTVALINQDMARGKIESMKDGKLELAAGETALTVPLGRVTQIDFARAAAPSDARGEWEVRAHFPGGGRLSFQLDKWNKNEVSGRNALFGPLAFKPDAIQELEFNLDSPRAEISVAPAGESDDFDEQ